MENDIKLFADYHTHTIFSHGKGTIADNVRTAEQRGLKEIAITDHGPSHILFGIRKKDFKKMRDEIDEINRRSSVKVLMGVECNIISIDGTIDLDDELKDDIDILLAGFHNGAMPKSIKDYFALFLMNFLARYIKLFRKLSRKYNTTAYINAIKKNKIDIISHPGLKADVDTKELAIAAKKYGTCLEINAGHGYMTVDYVKIAKKEGVKFCIDSDAHTHERVGDFKRGIDIAKKAGLKNTDILNAL